MKKLLGHPFLSSLVSHPAFAYSTILAVQLRAMWDFWSGRDLTAGDGSSYFVLAMDWATSLRGNFVWSPLYTAFFGAIIRSTGDVLAASVIHRVIVVFAVTVLVLALARQLMPPGVAWLVAAWWAILPINFNTLYEVHLFSAIPPLTAALLLARRPTAGGRAAALALLLTGALLVRYELAIAAALFGAICAWYEIRRAKRFGGLSSYLKVVRPYALALVISALIVSLFYLRSTYGFHAIRDLASAKAKHNFCQTYAFNYQQRNPEWDKSPWTECVPLIASTFGLRTPMVEVNTLTFVEAATRNPKAILDFVAWNARLVPNGLQLALFNESSGGTNPDYAPAKLNRTRPLALSLITILLVGVGFAALTSDRAFWSSWLRPRKWSLALLGCLSIVGVIVMLQQRPRPSYLFSMTVSIMIGIGICAAALARERKLMPHLAAVVPLVAALLLIFVPSQYSRGQRPLSDAYSRVRPFADELASGVLAVPAYGNDLCHYILVRKKCLPAEYGTSLRTEALKTGSFAETLNQRGVNLVYADAGVLANPIAFPFFEDPARAGWRPVARNQLGDPPWLILRRIEPLP